MLEYIILLLAIPLGLFARKLTKNYEGHIYKNYFKWIIPVIFISAVIFAFLDEIAFFTLTFIFIMLLFWNR